MSYTLHYAPDNASLIIRLVMDEMGVEYRTVLVDRRVQAQKSSAYLALNPNGLIPVLETPQGPIFETGAILLWLVDRHQALGPGIDAADRGDFLKWLFFLSNTVHADMRINYYTHLYAGDDGQTQTAVRSEIQTRLTAHLATLETLADAKPSFFAGPEPSALDYYLACMMRWMAIYPAELDRSWFSAENTPHLFAMLKRLEDRDATQRALRGEGLGAHPFTQPMRPQPPEGSAT